MIYFYLEIKMVNQINVGDQDTQQIGENQSSQPTNSRKAKISYWMILALILAVTSATLLGILTVRQKYPNTSGSQNTPTLTPQSSPTQAEKTSGPNEGYQTPVFSDPSGFYKLYYTVNPQTFDAEIFVKTREITPREILTKVTKVLELKEFYGGIVEVAWSRGQTNLNKQRFILKIIGPGDDIASDYLLSFDGTPVVKLEFPYTYYKFFRVLTWIDENRILVEQTDRDENSSQTVTTYWVAPVTDLSQKKIVSF